MTAANPLTVSDAGSAAPELEPADAVVADSHARPGIADRLFRESSLYFIANVAGRAVGFVMIPFYSRFLTPEQYGIVNLVELATLVVAIVFGLQSLGAALTRLWHDQPDEVGRASVISTGLITAALMGGGIAVVAAVAARPIADAIALTGYAALLRLAFLVLFLSSISELGMTVERMEGRARAVLVIVLVQTFATVALNIVFIGVVHFGVWGFVSSKVLVLSVSAAVLAARLVGRSGLAWRPSLLREFWRFGAPLVLSSSAYFAIHFADRIFLAHVSRAETGVYSLAYNFAFLLSILIGDSFSKSWGVSFYAYAADPGWEKKFARVALWLLFVLGSGAAGISLFGRDMLRLMVPAGYIPPLALLPLLVVGYFFREVGDFFGNLLLIEKASGQVSRIAMSAAALNIACNAALIPRFGIMGAAIATFATWIVYCLVCWGAAWRRFRVPFGLGRLARLLAIGGAVGVLWIAIRAASPIPQLLLDGVWFLLFLALTSFLYLDPDGRREAAAWLGDRVRALRPASLA